MLVEAEQRRHTGSATQRRMTNQVASAAASSTEVLPDGLDWHTFSAAYFPGRRRHDLQAVIAYGAYRRSYAVDKQTPEAPSRVEAKRGAVASTALQEWEDEGGAAF
jgi:ribosomal protein S19E (S16A)